MKEIATAFLKAQLEMGDAKKGATNPFFGKAYADLNSIREAVIPPLNAQGIAVLQPTVHIDGKNFVQTLLVHAKSGETFEGLTEILSSKQNDAQGQGSGISYARRYGLQSIANVGAVDDDGNYASGKTQQAPQPQNPTTPPIPKSTETANCKAIEACKTLEELKAVWDKIPFAEKNGDTEACKNKMKTKLTK